MIDAARSLPVIIEARSPNTISVPHPATLFEVCDVAAHAPTRRVTAGGNIGIDSRLEERATVKTLRITEKSSGGIIAAWVRNRLNA
jgi:hypothetical protein